jgi:hypothetical protein
MKLLRTMGKEILGLFLDDEFLAAAALVVVGVSAILAKTLATAPLAAGTILLGGCVGVLVMSVRRSTQPR